MSDSTRCVHLKISGRVQGVAYRYSAQRSASALGLSGWVRNDSDGTVEGVIQGSDESVRSFIEWCHSGPRLANVTDVQVTERAVDATLKSPPEIRY
ncbi:MAG: acylphosphatase [Planctomycetota bacterium]